MNVDVGGEELEFWVQFTGNLLISVTPTSSAPFQRLEELEENHGCRI